MLVACADQVDPHLTVAFIASSKPLPDINEDAIPPFLRGTNLKVVVLQTRDEFLRQPATILDKIRAELTDHGDTGIATKCFSHPFKGCGLPTLDIYLNQINRWPSTLRKEAVKRGRFHRVTRPQ